MDNGPLVKEEIEAGAELVREFAQVVPVKAAFWLKEPADDVFRYLYIAFEGAAEKGVRAAYMDLNRIARGIDVPEFDHSRVQLIDADDPMAQAAIKYRQQSQKPAAVRLGFAPFGDVYSQDAYIYPLPLTAGVT